MSTEFTSKQPSEAFYVCFDFTDTLGAETIASVTSVVALNEASLVDVTATVTDVLLQTNTTKLVYVWVKAGTTGNRYIITCKILGSAGSVLELDGILPVEEDPAAGTALVGGGLVYAPRFEPITLAEAKTHLRVDAVSAEDEIIGSMITTAREHVEDITRRAIITQTWDYCLDRFPSKDHINLPFGNLQSVTSVNYKNSAGVSTTMTVTTEYIVETNGEWVGRIVLPYGVSWPCPSTYYSSNPITIRFVCGWTTRALVPNRIKTAIMLILADLYEMRGEPILGQSVVESKTADRLLASCRLWGEFK